MAANINLASPESGNKSFLTGKATLLLSAALVIFVLAVYMGISVLGKKYESDNNRLQIQIQSEKEKIAGPAFADLADFQERITLLGQAIDDHAYWDEYLKRFSKYVLPDVRLSSFSSGESEAGISISGYSPNFEALSRAIILLQKSPDITSVEFKSGNENTGTEGQGGVDFETSLSVNEKNLKSKATGQ